MEKTTVYRRCVRICSLVETIQGLGVDRGGPGTLAQAETALSVDAAVSETLSEVLRHSQRSVSLTYETGRNRVLLNSIESPQSEGHKVYKTATERKIGSGTSGFHKRHQASRREERTETGPE